MTTNMRRLKHGVPVRPWDPPEPRRTSPRTGRGACRGSAAPSGSQGYFLVGINQPDDDIGADIGPEEQGSSSSGEDYFYDTGQFSLEIDSGADWSITVTPNAVAPLGRSGHLLEHANRSDG